MSKANSTKLDKIEELLDSICEKTGILCFPISIHRLQNTCSMYEIGDLCFAHNNLRLMPHENTALNILGEAVRGFVLNGDNLCFICNVNIDKRSKKTVGSLALELLGFKKINEYQGRGYVATYATTLKEFIDNAFTFIKQIHKKLCVD